MAMIILNDRVIGDDWLFHSTTPADVSDHRNLVAQLRDQGGRLLADSQGDDPSIILTGVSDEEANLEVPETDLGAGGGVIWAVIRRPVTRTIDPGYMVLQYSADGVSLAGRRTFGTFVFRAVDQVAVEVAP